MIPERLPNAAPVMGMVANVPAPGRSPGATPDAKPEASEGTASPVRRGEYLLVPSCAPYRLLRRVASMPDAFSVPGGDPYPVATVKTSGLTVRVKMEPFKGDQDDAEEYGMEPLRAGLDGWTADAVDTVAAKCLPARRGGETVEVSFADVLRARGITEGRTGGEWGRRRGGWKRSQMAHAKRALLQVASFSLRTQGRDARTGEEMPDGFSPAFEFSEVGDGRYRVRMGTAILRFLGGSAGSEQMGMLDRRVLRLRPRQDEVAKRLARHLSDLWRIRRREEKAGPMSGPWNVGTLLPVIGLEADGLAKPKRSLDTFRCALSTLAEAGIVGEITEEFSGPARRQGWTAEWVRSNVSIEPPPGVAATYRRMFEGGEPVLGVVEGGSKESGRSLAKLGERVRERREDLGWPQRKVAGLLGVPQPTVARLEKGRKVRLSDEKRVALMDWLSGGSL